MNKLTWAIFSIILLFGGLLLILAIPLNSGFGFVIGIIIGMTITAFLERKEKIK